MSKVAVVYWSGTGNTEKMANAVLAGIKENGADGELFTASEFSKDMVANYDAIAFGCPSMGAEELEETEFAPMFEDCKSVLNGKKITLFGSWGWGGGAWMETWTADCEAIGANLACDAVTCADAPDDDAIAACKDLGKALV